MVNYGLRGMSQLTVDSRKGKLHRFETCSHEQDLQTIGKISPSAINNFLASMRDIHQLDTATVNRHPVTLKAFWVSPVDAGYATSNPRAGVKLGRQQTKEVVKDLNEQQIGLLLSTLKGRKLLDFRDKAIIYILLDSGLHVEELANLCHFSAVTNTTTKYY